ncbi:MAG: DUF2971 domain-containing protein [Thermomicrobiales bacterium]
MRRDPLNPLLFHYTKRETAIERIFFDGTIRMGPLTLTNDPEESALGSFTLATNDEVSSEEFRGILDTCKRISTSPVRLACFTEESYNCYGLRTGMHGYEHGRMWAQYAGINSGVAIAFDKDCLIANMKAHFVGRKGRPLHGPVKYVERIGFSESPFHMTDHEEIKVLGLVAYARKQRDTFAEERYLRKTIDWQGEQEYRFVWIDDDDEYSKEGEYIRISDCVKSICLGTHFPPPYMSNVKAICERFDIRAYRITHEAGRRDMVPIRWV